MSGSIRSRRRYFLLKSLNAADIYEGALAETWRAKQIAEAATPLPANFPGRDLLIAAQYEAIEDVFGADVSELRKRAKLSTVVAEAAIAAAAAASA